MERWREGLVISPRFPFLFPSFPFGDMRENVSASLSKIATLPHFSVMSHCYVFPFSVACCRFGEILRAWRDGGKVWLPLHVFHFFLLLLNSEILRKMSSLLSPKLPLCLTFQPRVTYVFPFSVVLGRFGRISQVWRDGEKVW